MSAESEALNCARSFRWWQGCPDLGETEAERRDLEALRDACTELLRNADMG